MHILSYKDNKFGFRIGALNPNLYFFLSAQKWTEMDQIKPSRTKQAKVNKIVSIGPKQR